MEFCWLRELDLRRTTSLVLRRTVRRDGESLDQIGQNKETKMKCKGPTTKKNYLNSGTDALLLKYKTIFK